MKKMTTEVFIMLARQVHGDKYDYSKVEYINNYTKVCIICPIHGEFWQTPKHHLQGQGCPKCGIEKITKDYEEFVIKARKVHGDKFIYHEEDYIDTQTKTRMTCPEHGDFWQKPNNHLQGQGCPKCGKESQIYKLTKPFEEFVIKARKVHGDKFIYHEEDYKNMQTKTKITCPIHGEFWQKPNNHLSGNGCPKCNNSKLENEIMLFLSENKIEFDSQKTFKWLKNKSNLHLDFYLPKYNIAIECQGEQHFQPIEHFGGEKRFKYILERDNIKRKLCEINGIKLLYYSDLGIDYPYEVFENKEELLEEILNK